MTVQVSNQWQLDYLLNRLFCKGRNTTPLLREPPVTAGFPSQEASDVETVSWSMGHLPGL